MPTDPHHRFVRQFTFNDDWAGLLRYALGHGPHVPAIDAAIQVLDGMYFGEGPAALRSWIKEFREEPTVSRDVPNLEEMKLDELEQLTIQLVTIFPSFALCERALQAPVDQQGSLFRTGLLAAEQWGQLATYLQDHALQATGWALAAGAEYGLRRLRSSASSYMEALHLTKRLAHHHPDVYQSSVMSVLMNLGNVQSELVELRAAADSYSEALAIARLLAVSNAEFKLAVANTLNNLGDVHNSIGDFSIALTYLKEALTIHRMLLFDEPHNSMSPIASTLRNLGITCTRMNLTADAFTYILQATEVYRELANAIPGRHLPDLATCLMTLGVLQRNRLQFNDAIKSLSESLRIQRLLARHRPDAYLQDCADTLNALANTQKDSTCFEDAIVHYEEAIAIYRQLVPENEWQYLPAVAILLNNLASVQHQLGRTEDALANATESLSYHQKFEDIAAGSCRSEIANGLVTLSIVLCKLGKTNDAIDRAEQALSLYRSLCQINEEAYLPHVSTTLHNIAILQKQLGQFTAALASSAESIAVTRRLSVNQPEEYLPFLAQSLNTQGTTLKNMNCFKEAAESFYEARVIYRRLHDQISSSELQERIGFCRNYAQLVVQRHPELNGPNYLLARELYKDASDLAERFRGAFRDPRERIRVQQELQSLYRDRILICAMCFEERSDISAFEELLDAIEASRARSLLDAMVKHDLCIKAPAELREHFTSVQQTLRRMQRRIHQEIEVLDIVSEIAASHSPEPEYSTLEGGPGHGLDVRQLQIRNMPMAALAEHNVAAVGEQQKRIWLLEEQIKQQHIVYREIVDQLMALDGSFEPDIAVDSFHLSSRVELFTSDKPTAYVILQCVQTQIKGIVLTKDNLRAVSFPELSSQLLQMMQNALSSQFSGENSAEDVQRGFMHVLPLLMDELRVKLCTTLLNTFIELGVSTEERVVFVPDDVMCCLPLHAIEVTPGKHLGDLYEVAYTRSLSILQQCIRRRRRPPLKLFGIIDPTDSLAGPLLEAELAKRHFSKVSMTSATTHEEFLNDGHDADVFYWMGHSQFLPSVPYWSGLVLKESGRIETVKASGRIEKRCFAVAPIDFVTFTDIDCKLNLKSCTLAIISGCQSGLTATGKGNEPVSLVSAFLNAGAKSVLASLWPVDDRACLLTMHRFMVAWRDEKLGIAASLRVAQRWLRNLTANGLKTWSETCLELQQKELEEFRTAFIDFAEAMIGTNGTDYRPFESAFYWAPFMVAGHAWDDAKC